jgi:hypothetical protein
MNLDLLTSAWDGDTAVGYPVLFGLVLLGSIVPVVPTGLVVGTAAAFAMSTDGLGISVVLAVAAGALAYPLRRLVPASLAAAFLWALAYALLGVVSGGIFDSPLIAMLVATVLVLGVSALTNLISARRRRPVPAAREPEHCEST